MRLKKYKAFHAADNENAFWFISSGINGDITKVVAFDQMDEPNRWNLGMGDYNNAIAEVDDMAESGNNDARRIFATIGEITKYYTFANPEREIFLSGNTPEKKRTYSFMISFFFDEITDEFNVWGADKDQQFEPFIKGKIYDAILVKRK